MVFHDNDNIRILAVDPGSRHCGTSVIDWNPLTQKGLVIHAETINGDKIVRGDSFRATTIDGKTNRLFALSQEVAQLFQFWQPTVVALEGPFMGSFPQTFRVLSELTMLITQQILEISPLTHVAMIDPRSVKIQMGVAPNTKDKELMRYALNASHELSYVNGIDPQLFDEHTVDSICVGKWLANTIT